MIERISWYLISIRSLVEATPFVRAVLICMVLYQLDLFVTLALWLLRRARVLATDFELEPENRKSAIVVLPTLLRKQAELDGLIAAIRSIVSNGYPGPLYVVACIDGTVSAGGLYRTLVDWSRREPVPAGVELFVVGTLERSGKAVAMDHGVEFIKRRVAERKIPAFPELFFNMDADSALGERALERMVFRLTRRRWLARTPYHIVTSNVVVPLEQCYGDFGSLRTLGRWIALSVAREYTGSISAGKLNYKLVPCMEVSGALYCTWSDVYLAAPCYAAFLQQLRLRDWVKWWLGFGPPRFSEFRGAPIVEALTGPGDDTWMGWFASCCGWRNSRLTPEFPATPLHAFGALVLQYFSRAQTYDPLAKVYSKTPTTVRALFNQRLRWNSSRMQDLMRHGPSLAYHWKAGVPLLASTAVMFTAVTLFALTPFGLVAGRIPAPAPAFSVLVCAGYFTTRLTSTIAGLLISDSPRAEWIKLLALPISVPYHVVFNTLTMLIGYYRDVFGYGEPTTFAPEATLVRSNLERFAFGFRLRRAFWLTVRSALHGDVPFGAFWFGWKRTPFTPGGFDGWGSGTRPRAVYWPERGSKDPGSP
jgi:hypothetical protein